MSHFFTALYIIHKWTLMPTASFTAKIWWLRTLFTACHKHYKKVTQKCKYNILPTLCISQSDLEAGNMFTITQNGNRLYFIVLGAFMGGLRYTRAAIYLTPLWCIFKPHLKGVWNFSNKSNIDVYIISKTRLEKNALSSVWKPHLKVHPPTSFFSHTLAENQWVTMFILH